MNFSTVKTGRITSSIIIVLLIVSIIVLLFIPPSKYIYSINHNGNNSPTELILSIIFFLQILLTVPLFCSLFYYSENRKVFALTGLIFGNAYVIFSGLSCFFSISAATMTLRNPNNVLLSLFLPENHVSITYSLNVLGIFFLGVSFVFFSGIFNQSRFHLWIKTVFFIFSISVFIGITGYLFRIQILETMLLVSLLPFLAGIIFLFIEFGKLKTT